jgi:hypothetical protein
MLMRSALFWDITRRRVVIVYRRFGTTYIPGDRRAHQERTLFLKFSISRSLFYNLSFTKSLALNTALHSKVDRKSYSLQLKMWAYVKVLIVTLLNTALTLPNIHYISL